MSKHLGRKQRWTQESASRYRSDLGDVIYERGAWYALLNYQTLLPGEHGHELAAWEVHRERLGPFKRPRNAMVALERDVTFLRNHHGANMRLGGKLWAET